MDKLENTGHTTPGMHECTSYRDGDWIIFRCPLCPGYERRFNWVTGEMQVDRAGSKAQHTGLSTGPQNMEALARVYYLN